MGKLKIKDEGDKNKSRSRVKKYEEQILARLQENCGSDSDSGSVDSDTAEDWLKKIKIIQKEMHKKTKKKKKKRSVSSSSVEMTNYAIRSERRRKKRNLKIRK